MNLIESFTSPLCDLLGSQPAGSWRIGRPWEGENGRYRLEDLSHWGKIELHGKGVDGILTNLPPGVTPIQLHPQRALLICEPEVTPDLQKKMRAAAANRLTLSDQTAGLVGIACISGQVEEWLSQLCALNLRAAAFPPGQAATSSLAKVPTHLLRRTPERFDLFFPTPYATYLVDVLRDVSGSVIDPL